MDVFEDEPNMKPGLADCDNAVIVPHTASASFWTRAGMVSDAQIPMLFAFPVSRMCALSCILHVALFMCLYVLFSSFECSVTVWHGRGCCCCA